MRKFILTACLAFSASFLFASNEVDLSKSGNNKIDNNKKLLSEVKEIVKEKGWDCNVSNTMELTWGPNGENHATIKCKGSGATCQQALEQVSACIKKNLTLVLAFSN